MPLRRDTIHTNVIPVYGVRRDAAKAYPLISTFSKILGGGISNQSTPKWRAISKSMDSSLLKLTKSMSYPLTLQVAVSKCLD